MGVGAAGVKLQSVSSPAIHQSVISLQSVKEDSVLTDPEIDDLVEEPEEVEDTTQCYAKVSHTPLGVVRGIGLLSNCIHLIFCKKHIAFGQSAACTLYEDQVGIGYIG